MHADTTDIRTWAGTQSHQSTDVAAVAAALTGAAVAPDAFGSAGAGLVAAVNDALARLARHAVMLAERLDTGSITAAACADAYDDAESRSAGSVSGIEG